MYLGIVVEKDLFRIAIFKKEKQAIEVVALQTFPFGPENVKQFYNLPPFHTGKKAKIISGLSGTDVFIRKLHVPLREKRKILSTLPFQLETLIPYPAQDILACPLFKALSKQMTSVNVIATSKQRLSTHLSALKTGDILPDQVSCMPAALARFVTWQFPKENRLLALHASEDHIQCVLVEAGELAISQTLPILVKEEIPLELDKLFTFLKQKGAIDDQTPWILTGDDSFAKSIRSIFPGPQLTLEKPEYGEYALSLGLALDGLKADASSIQFCQREFLPDHLFESRKKKFSIYLGLCAIAAIMMSVSSAFFLQKKERAIATQLETYSPSSRGTVSSVEDIEEKLYEWEKSLGQQKTPFALVPTVPKVSDVLAWISTHPAFATQDGAKKEGLDIQSIHYSLIKYPKIGDPRSPYTAQVDIEFTALTPRAARDFHEALLKGDPIVNAKKEVKWQVQNKTYHTSFELNRGAGS